MLNWMDFYTRVVNSLLKVHLCDQKILSGRFGSTAEYLPRRAFQLFIDPANLLNLVYESETQNHSVIQFNYMLLQYVQLLKFGEICHFQMYHRCELRKCA